MVQYLSKNILILSVPTAVWQDWDTFFKFLSECLEKTPTIIDKMIENGDLKRVLNFLCVRVAPV